jgi:hypothetical protein
MIISPHRLMYYLLKAELIAHAQSEGHKDFLSKLEIVVAQLPLNQTDVWDTTRSIAERTLYYIQTKYRLHVDGDSARVERRPRYDSTTTNAALRSLTRKQYDADAWETAWIELPAKARDSIRIAAARNGSPLERMPCWARHITIPELTISSVRDEEIREGFLFSADSGFTIAIPSAQSVVQLIKPAMLLPRSPPRAVPERDDALCKIIRSFVYHTPDIPTVSELRTYPPDVRKRLKDHRKTLSKQIGRTHEQLRRFIESVEACYRPLITEGFAGLNSKSVMARLYDEALYKLA